MFVSDESQMFQQKTNFRIVYWIFCVYFLYVFFMWIGWYCIIESYYSSCAFKRFSAKSTLCGVSSSILWKIYRDSTSTSTELIYERKSFSEERGHNYLISNFKIFFNLIKTTKTKVMRTKRRLHNSEKN